MYDYKYEPHRVIFMIDMKSFYASCECIRLGLNPMLTELVVMSRQPRSSFNSGLIMAASPMAKKKYPIKNVMRGRDLPNLKDAPYEVHKKENLVYCDLIEHFSSIF